MSEPYDYPPIGGAYVKCPYCGEPEQEVEDLGDTPYFLTGQCLECGKGFSYEAGQYYNDKGDKIDGTT